MQFRPLLPTAGWLVAGLLFALSCFHYYTAGFGLLPETIHRGIHIAFVLGLIFLVFSGAPKRQRRDAAGKPAAPRSASACIDWVLAIAAVRLAASTCPGSSTTCSSASAIPIRSTGSWARS